MKTAIQHVLELVSFLEPERGQAATDIVVHSLFIDGVEHHHLVGLANQGDIHKKANNASRVRNLSLATVEHLQLCAEDHQSSLAATDIIDAFSNRALGIAAYELDEVTKLKPREHDIKAICGSFTNINELANLCSEFSDYEESLFEHLAQVSYSNHPAEYADRLALEYDRIKQEIETLRVQTIASPKAIELLSNYANTNHGIKVENRTTLFVYRPTDVRQPFFDEENARLSSYVDTIRTVFIGSRVHYQTDVVTVPQWAAELIKTLDESSVASKIYQYDQLEPNIVETAKVLWRESRNTQLGEQNLPVLGNFDVAFQAAEKLLTG